MESDDKVKEDDNLYMIKANTIKSKDMRNPIYDNTVN